MFTPYNSVSSDHGEISVSGELNDFFKIITVVSVYKDRAHRDTF